MIPVFENGLGSDRRASISAMQSTFSCPLLFAGGKSLVFVPKDNAYANATIVRY